MLVTAAVTVACYILIDIVIKLFIFDSISLIECHQVCHPKCAPSLPHTCGLPSQYVQHFSHAMHCKSASPKVGPVKGDNETVTLQSWMKIPRYV